MQVEQQVNKKTVSKKGGKSTKKNEAVVEEVQVAAPVEVSAPAVVAVEAPVQVQAPVEEVVQESAPQVVETTESSFQVVFDALNAMSEELSDKSKLFKEENMDRETRTKFESAFNKFNKSYGQFTKSYNEALLRQLNAAEKNGSKSSAKKTIVDKDKIAIHKKHNVHDFLLTFMKLPAGTQISRAEALTAITGFVKEQKVSNPDIIVADDKKSFKIIGDLKLLFDGIEKQMSSVGALKKPMPTQIKYTDIMTYMTHCFVKNAPQVV